ncbi:MAG: transcription antitermination factor NusB [Desulfobacterales bacterium]|nr:transcription antitermination factor NusB [Desulfobacterales bacterium]
MRNRSKARELALQALFYMDMRQNASEEMIDLYCENFEVPKKAAPFFLTLVKGVTDKEDEIDSLIERFSSNWKMDRMSCVDRNAMRVAVYEMLFCDDVPLKVSINEAINIGKKYGTEESGSFINGILDSIRISLESEK